MDSPATLPNYARHLMPWGVDDGGEMCHFLRAVELRLEFSARCIASPALTGGRFAFQIAGCPQWHGEAIIAPRQSAD